MSAAITDPLKNLDQARKQLADQQQRDSAAIAAACQGEFRPPSTLEGAAGIIAGLRRERDLLKTQIADMENAVKAATADMTVSIGGLLGDHPEGRSGATIPAVKALIRRLEFEASESGKCAKEMELLLENIKHSLVDHAFTELHGFAGYFSRATPLLACAEACAVHFHGDKTAKEAYLRRRKWKMNLPGSWLDPLNPKSVFPVDSAVLMQVKRDCERFKGLGHWSWKGIPTDSSIDKPTDPEQK